MSKNEFMNELMEQLKELPKQDREQVREYYDEMICDGIEQGRAEEDTVNSFGPVDKISQRIKEEYGQLVRVEGRDRQQQEENRSDEYESKVAVHTIRVKSANTSIQIRPSQSGQARILFEPREGVDHVTCTEENGVFSFEHYMTPFFSWGFRSISRGPIVVEVPVNFDGMLWVKTSNSSIRAEGLAHLNVTEFYTNNGRIETGMLSSDSMTVKSSNGKVILTSIEGRNLTAETSNGKIIADGVIMTEQMKLGTTNGGIEVRDITAAHLDFRTSNGAIKGMLLGAMSDYNITSSTSNGSNNLPRSANTDRTKTLNVKTSNAKINLMFER